jgi:hypothetical protein
MSAASTISQSPHPGPVDASPFGELASDVRLETAVRALNANGIHTVVVATSAEARKLVQELIPEHSEILDATSQTLVSSGIQEEIVNSGRYLPIRAELMEHHQNGRAREARKLGSAPDYVIGSVHAITEDGEVLIASATGSQLASYVYGAGKVVWVAGTQKVVGTLAEAFQRIEQHSFGLENERAKKAYGQGSLIGKVLVVKREVQPGRINLILVKEKLGF